MNLLNMRWLLLCLITIFYGVCCSAQQLAISRSYNLHHFMENTPELEREAREVYESLNERERVAQMIITSTGRLGKPYEEVKKLVSEGSVGGVIFLSGEPARFKAHIDELNALSVGRPLLFSIDAEPSLFNSRLSGVPKVPKTSELADPEEVVQATRIIDSTIQHLGFQQNYAPVIDLSKQNEAIGNRSFGSDSATVVPMAMSFVEQSTRDGIVSTIKHFPGHGRVAGDTHKKLVYIDGELTEAGLYRPFISSGVPSIMVGHIAVENNDRYHTNGLPATCSRVIVTELLREEMGFQGIVITDALNMGAVANIPNSGLLAARAGCDLLLMPPNEKEVIDQILNEMDKDDDFKDQIEASVLRVIKLKMCVGLSFNGSSE